MGLSEVGRFSEPALFILVSLAEGPKHGYAMMEDIGRLRSAPIGAGSLYGALGRLVARGWVEPLPAEDRRRPYRLTSAGLAVLRSEVAGLRALVETGAARLAAAT